MEPLPRSRPGTYSDIEALPEHVIGELIEGELIASPRPAPRHAFAASVLSSLVTGPFGLGRGGPGGWILLIEPELHLGQDVVVPDLAGWRREKMPELPDSAAIATAPNWACEILSPSTERIDRVRKQRIYAREGVEHVWHVHPSAQTLEVFHLEAGRWVRLHAFEGEDLVRADPFAAVELELGLLWAR